MKDFRFERPKGPSKRIGKGRLKTKQPKDISLEPWKTGKRRANDVLRGTDLPKKLGRRRKKGIRQKAQGPGPIKQ